MPTITYIILPSVVKERMSLHDNVDDKLIYPEILAVQDLYIQPLLGSNLLRKLLTDIAAGTLSGNYKTLVDDYLVMAVCNYVMSELPTTLQYQLYNKGVTQKTDENSNTVNQGEVYSMQSKYKQRAEHYVTLCRKYLVANSPLYPEYNRVVAGTDFVPHENAGFTCPIYLGDQSDFPPNDYSLNNGRPPDYNSNDPLYHHV